MSEIVYFELNNWFAGRDYPPDGKLSTWVETGQFNNDAWCRENKICVRSGCIDMSENWCITAPKEWVMAWCPELVEGGEYTYIICVYQNGKNWEEEHRGDYSDFLRYRDEYGDVCGRFGWPFLDYEEENFGVSWYSEEDE